jgi:hypothetical protein
MEPWLGHGIFAVSGERWKSQRYLRYVSLRINALQYRQLARPLFTIKSLESMIPSFIKHGHKVLDILSRHQHDPIDIQNLFMVFLHRRPSSKMLSEIHFGCIFRDRIWILYQLARKPRCRVLYSIQ